MGERQVTVRQLYRQSGWFKVWRRIYAHELWTQCPDSWFRVWFALMGTANHTPGNCYLGNTIIPVPRGSTVIGTVEFAKFCRVTRQQLRSALTFLATTNTITIKTTNHYSVVNVCNYEAYQGSESDDNQPDNQQNNQQVAKITSEITTHVTMVDNHQGNQEILSATDTENVTCGTLFDDGNQARNQGGNAIHNQQNNHNTRSKKEEKNNTSTVDSLLDEVAARIHARHPKRKCSLAVVKQRLRAIMRNAPSIERESLLKAIDACHTAWCSSREWQKEGGQFVKNLEGWLSPSLRRWEVRPESAAVTPAIPRQLM